jgi:hypothetical protein
LSNFARAFLECAIQQHEGETIVTRSTTNYIVRLFVLIISVAFIGADLIVSGQGTGRCDPNVQEQTDLSGTYTGTSNYTERGLSGDTTLTITGNDFTMTSGSTTLEGRVVAVTTCNYTAVTMMFGKPQMTASTGAQPAPLPAVSLRAKKVGDHLTLESVGGETRQFSFSSIVGGGKPRGRRGKRRASSVKPPMTMTHAH